jgi:pimeloyl-ACP methyl ester carboxylesterase
VILNALSRSAVKQAAAIDLADVVDFGTGSQSILFLHGLFGSPEHWRDVMDRLSDRYRVIAPQLPVDPQPGRRQHGISAIAELSDVVERLIDDLQIDPFVLCGNSLGGLVAIDLCARRPDFAAGLVLAGSAGLFERSPIRGLKSKPSREFVRSTVSGIVHRQELVTDQLVDEWYASIMDRDYVRFVLRVSRATRDRSVEQELAKLRLPTMIIWGQDDEITPPATGREFQRRIRGSQLEFIKDCGHAPNWERPDEFAAVLENFLPTCFV